MQTQVLIIGAGLSGLHTAYEMARRGVDFQLLEARDYLGGRILSHAYLEHKFDLGPTWFWPGQAHMQALVDELELSSDVFTQSSRGKALYENQQGRVQRGIEGISMAGSLRIRGGISQIIWALEKRLDQERVNRNHAVSRIQSRGESVITTIQGRKEDIVSQYVVLALPPRLAVNTIQFDPVLSEPRGVELNKIATWMAGQAKALAVYDNCFWHEQGLSGDVISHRGPLQEIHDASPDGAEVCALFGFLGVPATTRQQRESELQEAVISQLTQLFGHAASAPVDFHIKDWAFDPYTATETDLEGLSYHPSNYLSTVIEPGWNQQLIWSGTETSKVQHTGNGYLEGALDASRNTLEILRAALEQ